MPHKAYILDWVKLTVVGTGGTLATFALVNQALGTIAALSTIAYAFWKWRKDVEYHNQRSEYIKTKTNETKQEYQL